MYPMRVVSLSSVQGGHRQNFCLTRFILPLCAKSSDISLRFNVLEKMITRENLENGVLFSNKTRHFLKPPSIFSIICHSYVL